MALRLGTEVRGATGPVDAVVGGVCDDSRAVRTGDLYVAHPGSHVHGLDFETEAARRGAVAVVSDRPASLLPSLVVPEPRRVVGPLASWLYDDPSASLDVFGITGTNGKTSAAHLLDAALAHTGSTTGLVTGVSFRGPSGSRPATRTTPEAPLLQRTLARFRREGVDAVSMEVSSHAAVQHRVAGTRFRVMAFTNLGVDHLDFHGSMEEYFAAKASLFDREVTDAAVIDVDDEYGRRLARRIEVPCWTHSASGRSGADVVAEKVECDAAGTRFVLRAPTGAVPVRLPLLGPHQVRNALTAVTTAMAAGRDVANAANGLELVDTVPGRLERIDEGQPFLAIVDYVHNTHGQRTVFPYLRSLTSSRLIVVVGATGDRDPGKRFPLGAVAAGACDVVVVTDESPFSEDAATIRNEVAAGARSISGAEVHVEEDRRRALDLAVGLAGPGDVVVVTGRGCDPYQFFGDERTEFDDRDELRSALRRAKPVAL